jgi:hypothetical protein
MAVNLAEKFGIKIKVKYSDETRVSLDRQLHELFGEGGANFRKYLDERGYNLFSANYQVFDRYFNDFVGQVPELVQYIHDFKLFDEILEQVKDLLPPVRPEEIEALDKQ